MDKEIQDMEHTNLPESTPISSGLWPIVFLFGDSLTQRCFDTEGGWGSGISSQLARKCDILNRWFNGYNTRHAQLVLPKIVNKELAKDIVAATVFFGANDAAVEEASQHVPIAEYKANLVAIVHYLQSLDIPKSKILLICPPPVHEVKWAQHCLKKYGEQKLNRSLDRSKLYADACAEVAGTLEIEHLHTYNLMIQQDNWGDLLNDGLHLSKSGGEFVLTLIRPWVDGRTHHLSAKCPKWNEIQ